MICNSVQHKLCTYIQVAHNSAKETKFLILSGMLCKLLRF